MLNPKSQIPNPKFTIPFLVFLLSFGLYALLTHNHVFLAGNDASRFAHIESLGDFGVSHINSSRYQWTVDRVTIEGRDYSNKPPLLDILGTGVYIFLKNVFHLSFAKNEGQVLYLLTLILMGGTASWLAAEFYLALGLYPDIRLSTRGLVTLALAAGTILASYATTFNNHTIAAALLFASLRRAWTGKGGEAGVLAGLTFCVDILPGAIFIPLLGMIIHDAGRRRGLLNFFMGVFFCVVLFVAANLWTVGYPLPPKFVPGALDHSSHFGSSVAGVLLPERWSYPLECLFGGHGFFSVSPVLLFGVFGIIRGTRDQTPLPRRWTLVLAGGCLVFTLGHITLVGSYGGWSYGFRYLIPLIPILLFFAPLAIGSWRAGLFVLALAVSIPFALLGAYHPWPPAYEQERNKDPVASLVANPVGGNLAAWMKEYFPEAELTQKISSAFISSSPLLQGRYLLYFYESKQDGEMVEKIKAKLRGP